MIRKREKGREGERKDLSRCFLKKTSPSSLILARIITFTSVITRTKAWTVITPQGYYRLFATLAIIKNCRYRGERERISVFLKS